MGEPRKVKTFTYIGDEGVKMQLYYWGACGGAVALAAVASLADRRRNNRRNLDAVGFMPWPLIMIFAMISAAVLAAIALKVG